MMTKSKPIAVVINDVHFNLKNREIATKAFMAALWEAEELRVPLIVAGDLHDTKGILRGECISTIIDCVKGAKTKIKVLIGNHDLIHEKGEAHALEFLRPYVELIDKPIPMDKDCGVGFIPYQSTNEAFLALRNMFVKGQIIVCHQGFNGAFMGEYVRDVSSVHPDDVSNFRIISGHYHRFQNLGTITYVGTPYTTSFSEANDGLKGFAILHDDGSVVHIHTHLRRHVIIERTIDSLYDNIVESVNKDDIIWLKVSGPNIELDKLNKKQIGKKLFGHENFKFDMLPTDTQNMTIDTTSLSNEQIIDSIIDQDYESTIESKQYRKDLWRELLK